MVYNTKVVFKVKNDVPEIFSVERQMGLVAEMLKLALVSKQLYSSKMAQFANWIKLYALINATTVYNL